MNPYLVLDNVSYFLPDGRPLFTELNAQFGQERTGLVGRNDVGKSVLANILAQRLEPSAGRCIHAATVYYLAQTLRISPTDTLARLAGVGLKLEALARIERGSTAASDFEVLDEQWDIRQRLMLELERHGLGHLDPEANAQHLSGGEQMRVSLMAATLTGADLLILDEPSNHLDRVNRESLLAQLRQWDKGLVLISHDRQLLGCMDRILELSELGLRSYGGDYTFYRQCKDQERRAALAHLEHLQAQRKRDESAQRATAQRSAHKLAQGNKHSREANQAKVLLGAQKQRSQESAGKLHAQQLALRDKAAVALQEAAKHVQETQQISVHEIPVALRGQKRVLHLDAVELPFVQKYRHKISLLMTGSQRIAVTGPNGCGKSTLLKVIARAMPLVSGVCEVNVRVALLDQHFNNLDLERSTIAQLCEANPAATQAQLRTRLAHLGLDAQTIVQPCKVLSGGERLKAALACVLYAQSPPELLLLDEPSNHLDLESVEALELMLRRYRGALLVVSHDEVFLQSIGLEKRLEWRDTGWQLELC